MLYYKCPKETERNDIMKTITKVVVRVKKFSPFKYALNQILVPGYFTQTYDVLTLWIMRDCECNRLTALEAIYRARLYIMFYDYTWRDRDKLNLPNITERYPKLAGVWKSKIQEPL